MAPDSNLTISQIRAAEEIQNKCLKDLKKGMAIVTRHQRIFRRMKGNVYRLRHTVFPGQAYKKGQKLGKNDNFSKLPEEVKNIVFKALGAADRTCLALTCKSNAATYEQLRTEKYKEEYDVHVPKRPTSLQRLTLLVQLKPDVPPRFKLCYTCGIFVNTNLEENKGHWGGKSFVTTPVKLTRADAIGAPRCPLCVAAEHLKIASHNATHKQYVKLAEMATITH